MYAIGGNIQAAHVSGIHVARNLIALYAIAGALYGLGGVLEAARTGGATNNYGNMYELDAIAACVVGGVSTAGGIGTVPGVMAGVLIFGVINYGLTFIGVSPYWQLIIKGLIIVAAVAFDIRKAYFPSRVNDMCCEAEKRRLREKNDFLTLHDPLTGLLNYEGYMDALNKTVEEHRSFLLIILNIQNLNGFDKEVEDNWCSVIRNTGESITKQFSDSYGISRYAGDRYAVILPEIQDIEERMTSLLSGDLRGLQVNYSISLYPGMSDTLQHFITVAEDSLFQHQRNKWLKNEEEVFRSERLRAVGELAAGMAHEIRNPLTAIRGFLQLSRGQAFNIAPWYEVIMGEITRVTELTAEFLQFSKPHTNHMKPERVGHCLERVMSLTESDAASRGHRITLEMTGEPVVVNMDRDKIVQVLINLIRNAFEAMTDPGEVHIDLLHDGDKALISISDTGSGIPEKSLATIFNPFYTTKEEGTGLGLALCQKIALDHHGKITVHSELGIGSTFTLHLPMGA
ncbi:hypothetical protein G195_001831 [Phytophthora kernoviae 00238/432]|uniref:Histidine kinase n=1 Tax=Phytophthora kernoviae 00238/432 TaxID=1284355 RepID=A0A8J4STN3_9STRA|nr:hypothetical protein G195_001831 [Phytophthora kernoviae 00238/432]